MSIDSRNIASSIGNGGGIYDLTSDYGYSYPEQNSAVCIEPTIYDHFTEDNRIEAPASKSNQTSIFTFGKTPVLVDAEFVKDPFDKITLSSYNYAELMLIEHNFDELTAEDQEEIRQNIVVGYFNEADQYRKQALDRVNNKWQKISGKPVGKSRTIAKDPEQVVDLLIEESAETIRLNNYDGYELWSPLAKNQNTTIDADAMVLELTGGVLKPVVAVEREIELSEELRKGGDPFFAAAKARERAIVCRDSITIPEPFWESELTKAREKAVSDLRSAAARYNAPVEVIDAIEHLSSVNDAADYLEGVENVRSRLVMASQVQKIRGAASEIIDRARRADVWMNGEPLADIIERDIAALSLISDPLIFAKEAARFIVDLQRYEAYNATWELEQMLREHKVIVDGGIFSCDLAEIEDYAYMEYSGLAYVSECHRSSSAIAGGYNEQLDDALNKVFRARELLMSGNLSDIESAYSICSDLTHAISTEGTPENKLFKAIANDADTYQTFKTISKLGIIVTGGFLAGIAGAIAEPILGLAGLNLAAAKTGIGAAVFMTVDKGANYAAFDEKIWDPLKSTLNNFTNLGIEYVETFFMFVFFEAGGKAYGLFANNVFKPMLGENAVSFVGRGMLASGKLLSKYTTFSIWDRAQYLANSALMPMLGREVVPLQSEIERAEFFVSLEIASFLAAPFLMPIQDAVANRLCRKFEGELNAYNIEAQQFNIDIDEMNNRLGRGQTVDPAEFKILNDRAQSLFKRRTALLQKMEAMGLPIAASAKKDIITIEADIATLQEGQIEEYSPFSENVNNSSVDPNNPRIIEAEQRMFGAVLREALAMVDSGELSKADVDNIARLSIGRRLGVIGPLSTADLGGLDVFLDISNDLMPTLNTDSEPTPGMLAVLRGANGNTASASEPKFGPEDMQAAKNIKKVAVIGAGTMSAGIAMGYALNGNEVVILARSTESKNKVIIAYEDAIMAYFSIGLITLEEKNIAFKNIRVTLDLKDAVESADLVIETIPENLQAKRDLFKEIEKYAGPDTILATNTSGLSLKALSSGMAHPDNFVLLHYWNPPHLMPLVEVMGLDPSSRVVKVATALIELIGKEPVVLTKELQGHVGNRLQFALLREATALLDQGYRPVEIDLAVTNGFGSRMGKVGPIDLAIERAGANIEASLLYMFPKLSNERQSPKVLKNLIAQKRRGVKDGNGIYVWTEQDQANVIYKRNAKLIDQLNNDLFNKKLQKIDLPEPVLKLVREIASDVTVNGTINIQNIFDLNRTINAITEFDEASAIEFLTIVRKEPLSNFNDYLTSYKRCKELRDNGDISDDPEQFAYLVTSNADAVALVAQKTTLNAVSMKSGIEAIIERRRFIADHISQDEIVKDELYVSKRPISKMIELDSGIYIRLEYGDYEASTGMQFSLYMDYNGGRQYLGSVGFNVNKNEIEIVRYQGGRLIDPELQLERFREFSGGVNPMPWLAYSTGRILLDISKKENKKLMWIRGESIPMSVPHAPGRMPTNIRNMEDVVRYWQEPNQAMENTCTEYDKILDLSKTRELTKEEKMFLQNNGTMVIMYREGGRTTNSYNNTAENLGFRLIHKNNPWYRWTKSPNDFGKAIRMNRSVNVELFDATQGLVDQKVVPIFIP